MLLICLLGNCDSFSVMSLTRQVSTARLLGRLDTMPSSPKNILKGSDFCAFFSTRSGRRDVMRKILPLTLSPNACHCTPQKSRSVGLSLFLTLM